MATSISVLLITDSVKRRQSVTELLAEHNAEVLHVTDASSAVTKLKQQEFDVIVSDTLIGQMDAWRLVRMVRANLFRVPAETPYILITDTFCEHIAKTTAHAFTINHVVACEHLETLPDLILSFSDTTETPDNRMSVLVVEDDPDIAELAHRLLKNNYKVQIATTGTQGVSKFRDGHFDIVLLDVQLPEMSGGEVLKHVLAANPQQAVVIMTAHGSTELAEELLIQGAVDFISKPFKGEQLRKVIAIASQRENYLVSNSQFEEKVITIKRREEQFRQLSEAHTRLLNHLSTVVMELDTDGYIKFINKAWVLLTGFSREDTMGRSLADFAFGDDGNTRQYVEYHMSQMLEGQTGSKRIEFQLEIKSGEAIWVEVQFNDLYRKGKVSGVTVNLDNIDDRKKAEMQLSHLASHDTLTNLFNRHYFDTELVRLSETAQSQEVVHSLLYLDLDHFKVINDTQGHHQGDIILKEVATAISSIKREADVFCRVGGDEFALLLPRTDRHEARDIANEICALLQQGHYQFGDRIFKISCSIGATEINGEQTEPETYLQQADIALYVAKKRGRNLVHVFEKADKETEDFQISVQWVHVLQEAISKDQLILHFQPVVDAETRNVHYFEALVRLEIDGKLIFPGEFIPAIERVEDINLLDHQVISKAMSMISKYPVLKKSCHQSFSTSLQ
ncbi:diguanylate cyclase [Planctobacterium marinum]|uniref:Two-component system response regulator n=1 Tax=Planctobacterium marinum TaxID=1631968 RepID=A0AA48HI28_9ALTE|nr:two-component system response regulator [Planctobacterium marinum]